MVQIDCPDLGMGHHAHKVWQSYSLPEFKEQCALHVEALIHATRNIPADRLRLHMCWGNYEGPHTHDVEFRDVAPEVYIEMSYWTGPPKSHYPEN